MKRSEVTADALRRMGYKAMVEYTSWNSHTEEECTDKQAAELFELVAKTARDGGKVEIRRNHVTLPPDSSSFNIGLRLVRSAGTG